MRYSTLSKKYQEELFIVDNYSLVTSYARTLTKNEGTVILCKKYLFNYSREICVTEVFCVENIFGICGVEFARYTQSFYIAPKGLMWCKYFHKYLREFP